jgi:sporulation protein YlmC with PRC-barrel domain
MARRPRLADATLLTDLIGRAVYAEGRRIGRVRDLAARPVPAGPWPIVSLRLTGRAQTVVPAARIRGVQDDRVELAAGTAAPAPHGAVWLRDGVLDREVVDGVGRRIVRVGDVVIAMTSTAALLVMLPGLPLLPVLYLSQALNAVLLVPLLVFMLRLAADRRIMGDHTSPRWVGALGWATVAAVGASVVALAVTTLG